MQISTPKKIRWMKWQEEGWRTVAAEGPPASARSFTLSPRSGSKWSRMVCVDGTGTRPDFLVNCVDQTIEGHLQKNGTKIEK